MVLRDRGPSLVSPLPAADSADRRGRRRDRLAQSGGRPGHEFGEGRVRVDRPAGRGCRETAIATSTMKRAVGRAAPRPGHGPDGRGRIDRAHQAGPGGGSLPGFDRADRGPDRVLTVSDFALRRSHCCVRARTSIAPSRSSSGGRRVLADAARRSGAGAGRVPRRPRGRHPLRRTCPGQDPGGAAFKGPSDGNPAEAGESSGVRIS